MFLELDLQPREQVAALDDSGNATTYGDLVEFAHLFLDLRLPRCVVFCLCENSVGSLAGYVAFENNGQIPLLLSTGTDDQLLKALDDAYLPSFYWLPTSLANEIRGAEVASRFGYSLVKTPHDPYEPNKSLSLLLTTSGSTGSAKLVRYKYGNLEANAKNVAELFGWTKSERGICDLPMNYTMGLNVINSYLVVGATALLVKSSLVSPDFWEFVLEQKGTSFCGVPYSYDIMKRLGFDKMDLPNLKTLAQGGGKMTDSMFSWIADYCERRGKRFFATFGTTETSARMTYLPSDLATSKTGSIGWAIPHGEVFLDDEQVAGDGSFEGELCYRGPNVTMGYATNREDLSRGDDFGGEYHTGDLARRDADGCYYVVGRKGRFLKLFGLRVGLDEAEQLICSEFGCDCACVGTDKRMVVFVTDDAVTDKAVSFISSKTGIHHSAFRAVYIPSLPRNDYGKVSYSTLGEVQRLD